MKNVKRLVSPIVCLSALFFSPSLVGCKGVSTTSESDTANVAPNLSPGNKPENPLQKTYVLVTFGGYISCGQNPRDLSDWSPLYLDTAAGPILPFATKIREQVQAANNTKLYEFITCFNPDPRSIYLASNLTGKLSVENLPVDSIYARLEEKIKTLPNPEIAVVGFSYGGSVAMEFVSRLSSQFKPTYLVTLDAISLKECTPAHLIRSINLKQFDGPCQNFPPDYSGAKINQISDRVRGKWTNYYQRRSLHLRSNPVQDSRKRIINIFKDYQDPEISLLGHAHFIIDGDVVREIAQKFSESFRS